MRTGLDASTVTPGSAAPDSSRTCPANWLWAWATRGNTQKQKKRTRDPMRRMRGIAEPPWIENRREETASYAERHNASTRSGLEDLQRSGWTVRDLRDDLFW